MLIGLTKANTKNGKKYYLVSSIKRSTKIGKSQFSSDLAFLQRELDRRKIDYPTLVKLPKNNLTFQVHSHTNKKRNS